MDALDGNALDGNALDGNAIGGLLIDVFGTEMTAAATTCATCGASRPLAELVVYRRAPGTVVRCRTCGAIVMVFVRRMERTSVDLSGLTSLSEPRALWASGRVTICPGHTARGSHRDTRSWYAVTWARSCAPHSPTCEPRREEPTQC